MGQPLTSYYHSLSLLLPIHLNVLISATLEYFSELPNISNYHIALLKFSLQLPHNYSHINSRSISLFRLLKILLSFYEACLHINYQIPYVSKINWVNCFTPELSCSPTKGLVPHKIQIKNLFKLQGNSRLFLFQIKWIIVNFQVQSISVSLNRKSLFSLLSNWHFLSTLIHL